METATTHLIHRKESELLLYGKPKMAPNPYYRFSFWDEHKLNPPRCVKLSVFMPNGIFIELDVNLNSTLAEIKDELWEVAERKPLFGHLKPPDMYVIGMVSKYSSDELYDETRRLVDIQPYFCIFRLTSKQISINKLQKNINNLIGRSLNEITIINNPEIIDFRYKMYVRSDIVAERRRQMTWLDKMSYLYKPRTMPESDVPCTLKGRLRGDSFVLVAKFPNNEVSFTFNVNVAMQPSRLIETILVKKALVNPGKLDRMADHILKVAGREEYLYCEYPLIQFLYVQDTLSGTGVPTVILKPIKDVKTFVEALPDSRDFSHHRKQSSTVNTLRKKGKTISSWDIDQPFRCTIQMLKGLNTAENMEIGVQVGLFHGGKSLCEPQKTGEQLLSSQQMCNFEEELMFNINVKNVPRMARLCLVIYEIAKNTKGNSGTKSRRLKDMDKEYNINLLAWANTPVYDFKEQLKTGPVTLYTWPYMSKTDTQSEDLFQPLQTVEQNPRIDECASIVLKFHNYDIEPTATILYPTVEAVLEYAELNKRSRDLNRSSAHDNRPIRDIVAPYITYCLLNEIHEDDRIAIWSKRNELLVDEPNGLPCLLHCVEWKNREEVAEMTRLLKKWPSVPVERALELLDYAYADKSVRQFAVKCLSHAISDGELELYLLQLVQAIKHESYIDCELVQFVLDRALNNKRIGHYLFWHLRSEMSYPAVQIRFGLILEGYLVSSTHHMPFLLKQSECIEKFRQCSEMVKNCKEKGKGRAILHDFLKDPHNAEIISYVVSPLNPSYYVANVRTDECTVMDSKMRPLYISYDNLDPHGDKVNVIFKNGDDLRQDMFIIQMLRIMERIWKKEGHDFRMSTYDCISVDRHLGMIEVVSNAETIANIQKERGMFSAASPFRKGSLLAWMKEFNPTEDMMDKAINEFTHSCAAYCVATYVFGVADRHSDNIMLKQNGQLFHIDFGHFLGHIKYKYLFRREYAPFVLTHDFVYVINKGTSTNKKNGDEFKLFQNLCEEAFLIMRKNGSLIISLFAMMIATGLPELTSEKDLNYLRETLVMDKSENEAREHFRQKFGEALENSWKTSLNWASHNFSRNNKQ